ncbi:MAG: glycosyltransferase family 2 protein [Chlamydiales bacterium]|nr:glycosyltransferase family 2 protein [Chlamydiales bacterium]
MPHADSSPFISIVILNWNGKRDTLACLESVAKIDYPRFETILVDNGSTDDSVKAVREKFPGVTLLETGANLGFAGGNNVGIAHALKTGADAILLLNNDTEVDPGLLKAFAAQLKNQPEAGILGATIYLFDERERLDHLGGNWNKKRAAFDFIGHRERVTNQVKTLALDYVCGAALLARREVFEKVGELEPLFFLIWEEADFCMRAKRAGFLSMTCPDAQIWHKVSASFVGGKRHTTYFWWRNRLLWIERNCSRMEILSLYLRVLLPEISHLLKLRLLKGLQLHCLGFLQSPEKKAEKRQKLTQYRAALRGISDYLLRRFGSAPPWIFQK